MKYVVRRYRNWLYDGIVGDEDFDTQEEAEELCKEMNFYGQFSSTTLLHYYVEPLEEKKPPITKKEKVNPHEGMLWDLETKQWVKFDDIF